MPEFDAVGGVANTAEWVPQAYANNDPVTMTMEDGFSGTGNARSFGYAYGQSLEIDFKPEKEITVTASVSGQAVETGVDLTDPVTSLDVSLLHSTDVEVRIATTEAGLDTGQIIPLDVKFKIGKVRGDVYGVAPVRSFSGTAHSMPDVSFDLVFARGVDSEGFLSSIDSDEVYYIEIIAAGVEIEDGLKNSLTIRAPIQFGNPGESAQQDAHVTTFTADCIQVDTFNVTGGFIKVTAQSAMASLS